MKFGLIFCLLIISSEVFAQDPDSMIIMDPLEMLNIGGDSLDLMNQIQGQLARQEQIGDSLGAPFELYPRLERADYLIEFRKLAEGEPNPGMTPLMVAAFWNDIPSLEKNLARPILVDQRDNAGFTALMHAVNKGNEQAVSILLKTESSLFVKDIRGETLLHKAARSNLYGAISRWAERGLMPEVRDKYGVTPLMMAVYQRNFNAAHEILKISSNSNLRDNSGASCLHWLFMEQPTELGELSKAAKREFGLTPITNSAASFFSRFNFDRDDMPEFSLYDWLYLLKKYQVNPKIKDYNNKVAWELIEDVNLKTQISDAWTAIFIQESQ